MTIHVSTLFHFNWFLVNTKWAFTALKPGRMKRELIRHLGNVSLRRQKYQKGVGILLRGNTEVNSLAYLGSLGNISLPEEPLRTGYHMRRIALGIGSI